MAADVQQEGGQAPPQGGLVYVWAMSVVCLCSFFASGLRIIREPDKAQSPLFLVLVGVLAAVATLWGVRILKQKKRNEAHRGIVEWAAAAVLTACGAGGVVYWATGATVLFLVFGLLSVWTGFGFMKVLRGAPESKWFWWYEHLGGMLVACISTLTAFLVVNYGYAPQVIRDVIPGIVVWVAPGVIGGAAITWLNIYYRKKLES